MTQLLVAKEFGKSFKSIYLGFVIFSRDEGKSGWKEVFYFERSYFLYFYPEWVSCVYAVLIRKRKEVGREMGIDTQPISKP